MKTAQILLVDDEGANIEILRTALERRGHCATGVSNAEAAASALSAASYDLVLLDHVLPGMTGMQSLGKLRALTQAPIHIMSGYSDDDTKKDALLLGAAGFLAKPLDLAAIFALLDGLPERPQ